MIISQHPMTLFQIQVSCLFSTWAARVRSHRRRHCIAFTSICFWLYTTFYTCCYLL